jgi:beta-glucosidase
MQTPTQTTPENSLAIQDKNPPIRRADFPKDFVWGCATSSYQIEGATNADGRGTTIWDTFCRDGNIVNNDNGDMACDHYHRYPEDVRLLKHLGVNAYRFSVAWSRILPDGNGKVEARGLDFYDRLVDKLLEQGITPWLTLNHWDLPQSLENKGGWAVRSIVDDFANYANIVSSHLGDRVKHWITHNEPWCVAYLGYHIGYFAPGKRNETKAIQASHHLLLSHGMAVPIIRANSSQADVGITLNVWPIHPASGSAEDIAAAKRLDGFVNRWWLDPLYERGYPEDMLLWYGDKAPDMQPEDLGIIATPTDFLGVNYYQRDIIAADQSQDHLGIRYVKPAANLTDFGWEIYPQGLSEQLERLHREWGVSALYVTENGSCWDDALEQGVVRDHQRQAYLESHLYASLSSLKNSVPLKGYFAWSLLDNFEWSQGYSKRFGLVYVDFSSQQRIVKQSGQWFRHFLQEHL